MVGEAKAGERIGEYVLHERLGQGGGGTVWKAEHAWIPGRWAALKLPHEPELVGWLQREGLIQSRLDHPGVVRVYGGNLEGPRPYVVMELVEGGDLRKLLANGPLPPARARALSRGILEALAAAHRQGIVHGDLKPENVLLAADGSPKLTDFGLARTAFERELEHSLAVTSPQLSGTLRYAPPELFERGRPTPRTDVYSFGVLLFEVLVGRTPQGLESPQDHGVAAADLDALFRRCYAPESRRAADAAEALALLKNAVSPRAPRGRLISKPPRGAKTQERAGFFARWFGGAPDGERTQPAAQSGPAAPPGPAA
ncbi:MAG: serine/threonine protein kinase, partial [Planctomycetota bacterium]